MKKIENELKYTFLFSFLIIIIMAGNVSAELEGENKYEYNSIFIFSID